MKRLLLVLIFSVFINVSTGFSMNLSVKEDPERIELISKGPFGNKGEERSLSLIEVNLYRQSNYIQAELQGIGDAAITLYNLNGDIIFVQNVYTNSHMSVCINIPASENSYIIEITSSKVYSIGYLDIY